MGSGCENDNGVLQKPHLDKFCRLCSLKTECKAETESPVLEAGPSLLAEGVNAPLSTCCLWIKHLRSFLFSIFSVRMSKQLKLKAFSSESEIRADAVAARGAQGRGLWVEIDL